MALEGSNANECLEVFLEQMNRLLVSLLGPSAQLTLKRNARDRAGLYFGNPQLTAPLDTRIGKLHLYIAQELRVKQLEGQRFRLETHSYWYHLLQTEGLGGDEFMRWEYEKKKGANSEPCRNHLHIHVNLPLGNGKLELKKTHLPTGWVTIEELLRFLITDLGVEPGCRETWAQQLHESEQLFFTQYSSKLTRAE